MALALACCMAGWQARAAEPAASDSSDALEIPPLAPGTGPAVRPPEDEQPAIEPDASVDSSAPLALPELAEVVIRDDRPPAAIPLRAGSAPDYIEASSIDYARDGSFRATGVTLYITSLVTGGGPAVLEAASLYYNPATGSAELTNARIRVDGTPIELAVSSAEYDAIMRRLKVRGLSLPIPLRALVPEEQLGDEVRAKFASHTRMKAPAMAYLDVGELYFERGIHETTAVLRDVRASAAQPTADLYITAREVRLEGEKTVVLDHPAVWLEGAKVLSLPRYNRKLGGDAKDGISFDTPRVNLDAKSFAIREDVSLANGNAHLDVRLDYSTDRGNFLAHGFAYVEPVPGAKLGVSAGGRVDPDIRRRSVERREDYNFVYRQQWASKPWFVTASAEYGDTQATLLDQTPEAAPVQAVRARGYADAELCAEPLGGGWYATGGATASLTDYGDTDYRVLGGRAGLIYHEQGFNHFVVYRHNETLGEPLFSFDEVRQRELDAQTRLSLIPRFSNIVRAVYDLDLEDFERLQVGSLVERKGYEFGFYWDFARQSAGVEFGLPVK